MEDVAAARAGGSVVFSSSADPRCPPKRAIDQADATFWSTTGLYPQELVIRLARPAAVRRIRLSCSNIRRLRVQCHHFSDGSGNTTLADIELEENGGRLQLREWTKEQLPNMPGPHELVTTVRVVILSGWHSFCSLHQVEILAEASQTPQVPLRQAAISTGSSATFEGPGALQEGANRGIATAATAATAASSLSTSPSAAPHCCSSQQQ
mmetsp:Transcript_79956/g.166252  ORF Transcript_79956/g.166252 Transcript_79956/m.166252 type:complete len:209 (+) Transcript_79956:96-722(+)